MKKFAFLFQQCKFHSVEHTAFSHISSDQEMILMQLFLWQSLNSDGGWPLSLLNSGFIEENEGTAEGLEYQDMTSSDPAEKFKMYCADGDSLQGSEIPETATEETIHGICTT